MKIGDDHEVRTLTEYMVERCNRGYCDEEAPYPYVDLTGEEVCRHGRRLLFQGQVGDWSEVYPTAAEAHAALSALHCGHGIPEGTGCADCEHEVRADLARQRWREGA